MGDQEMNSPKAAENEDRPELKSSLADFKLALVQSVRDFPILYNGTPASRTIRNHAWTSVAGLLDEYFADDFTDLKTQSTFCKKQWDIVRRNFRRDAQEQREGRKKKAWWGRKHMAFLHPYYSAQMVRKKKEEVTEEEDNEEETEDGQEVDFSAIPVSGLPESESSTVSFGRYSHDSTPKRSSVRPKSTKDFFRPSKKLPLSPTVVEDEADLQVRVWLTKLKRLPPTDQRRAMKRMSDVLYEAEESVLVAQSIPAASD